MDKTVLLLKTKAYVQEKMEHEPTGHDWFHIERVLQMADMIAKKEGNVDLFIIQLAAILHDIGDWKLNSSQKSEKEILQETLIYLNFPKDLQKKITDIILHMSYSSNLGKQNGLSKEGCIVQDADRLDALGAIGIARAFAYGGKKGREIYNPTIKPKRFISTNSYRNAKGTTVNHFYEKLFLLKELLNTKSAIKIARKRERFMKIFLDKFYNEWENKS